MMKLIRKMSLRLRLSLLMGMVLTVACIAFLLASNASARDIYRIGEDEQAVINPNIVPPPAIKAAKKSKKNRTMPLQAEI